LHRALRDLHVPRARRTHDGAGRTLG